MAVRTEVRKGVIVDGRQGIDQNQIYFAPSEPEKIGGIEQLEWESYVWAPTMWREVRRVNSARVATLAQRAIALERARAQSRKPRLSNLMGETNESLLSSRHHRMRRRR